MKKSLVVLLFAGIMAACGTKPEATVEGTVTGIADGTKVYLHDNSGTRLDSTAVAGGKFRFEIAKAYPDMFSLSFDGKPGNPVFFIEPGTITATVNFDDKNGVVFSGTPANDLRSTTIKEALVFTDRMEELGAELTALGLQGGELPSMTACTRCTSRFTTI